MGATKIPPGYDGSDVLPNAKWEMFAQNIIAGMDEVTAHGEAGYKAHRGNAARLMSTDAVKQRINFLLRKRATTSMEDADRLNADYRELYEMAKAKGNLGVARAALADIGKLNQLFTNEIKVEHAGAVNIRYSRLPDDEINRLLAARLEDLGVEAESMSQLMLDTSHGLAHGGASETPETDKDTDQ